MAEYSDKLGAYDEAVVFDDATADRLNLGGADPVEHADDSGVGSHQLGDDGVD